MASDILIYRPQAVPVGKDQVQHIEMTQDMAGYFNNTYKCDVLVRPEPLMSAAPVVPGIDGQKMSKSYGNHIELFDDPKAIKKRIMSIKTDSTPVPEAKNPDNCNAYAILRLLAGEQESADWADYRAGGVGYGEVKFSFEPTSAQQLRNQYAPNSRIVEFVLKVFEFANALLDNFQGRMKPMVAGRFGAIFDRGQEKGRCPRLSVGESRSRKGPANRSVGIQSGRSTWLLVILGGITRVNSVWTRISQMRLG